MLAYERIGDAGRRGVPQEPVGVGLYAGAVELAIRQIVNDFKCLLAREVIVPVKVDDSVDDGDSTPRLHVFEELLPCGSECSHVVTSDGDVVTT